MSALEPNGRLRADSDTPPHADLASYGVEKLSWGSLLYGVTSGAYLAPPGKDPTADILRWHQQLAKGEPYPPAAATIGIELQTYHSAVGVPFPQAARHPSWRTTGGRTRSFLPPRRSTTPTACLRPASGTRCS